MSINFPSNPAINDTFNAADKSWVYTGTTWKLSSVGGGGGGSIPAYSNWVLQDENSAKYTIYNGYDALNNPTPNLSNMPFSFILNNSATATIVLNNTVMTQINNVAFQDNSVGINSSYMPLTFDQFNTGFQTQNIAFNNGYLYLTRTGSSQVFKYYENNLVLVGNTASLNSAVSVVAVNNGFLYCAGASRVVTKFYENNLALIAANQAASSTNDFGGLILDFKINNGYIYASGQTANKVEKYFENNLVTNANSVYNGNGTFIFINNGSIFVTGPAATGINRGISKYFEDNLALDFNSPSLGATPNIAFLKNGYVYIGIGTNITQYYESNLISSNVIVNYGIAALSATINNGFLYIVGNGPFKKYYENNLSFLTNGDSLFSYDTVTANKINVTSSRVFTNNGLLYIGGINVSKVQRYYEQTDNLVNTPIYVINRVKE